MIHIGIPSSTCLIFFFLADRRKIALYINQDSIYTDLFETDNLLLDASLVIHSKYSRRKKRLQLVTVLNDRVHLIERDDPAFCLLCVSDPFNFGRKADSLKSFFPYTNRRMLNENLTNFVDY